MAPSSLRTRSGLGLLIVVLLLVHLYVFSPATCPIRPPGVPRFSAGETAALILSRPDAASAAQAPALSLSR